MVFAMCEAAKVQSLLCVYCVFKFSYKRGDSCYYYWSASHVKMHTHSQNSHIHTWTNPQTNVNHINQLLWTWMYSIIKKKKNHCAWLFCIRTYTQTPSECRIYPTIAQNMNNQLKHTQRIENLYIFRTFFKSHKHNRHIQLK